MNVTASTIIIQDEWLFRVHVARNPVKAVVVCISQRVPVNNGDWVDWLVCVFYTPVLTIYTYIFTSLAFGIFGSASFRIYQIFSRIMFAPFKLIRGQRILQSLLLKKA